MKVLFVTYPEFPLEIGGFQSQVREIYSNLIGLGIDVNWYTIDEISLSDYDIIHCFSSAPSLLPIIKKAKDLKIPIVLTPMIGSRSHTNSFYKFRLFLTKIPQVYTYVKKNAQLIKLADIFAPLSQYEAVRLINVYNIDKNKIHIIPNGINEIFFSEEQKEVALPFDKYVLMIGRIEKNKNQFNAIKAINSLNANMIIVGDIGIGSTDYYHACQQISGGNIYFWGKELDMFVIKTLYRKAQLTLIASYSEMVPLVAYESLSQRTPVLCTNRCSLFGENTQGLFFTHVTKKSLELNIRKALSFNRSQISNEGIFRWREIAIQYKDIYEQLNRI